MSKKNKPVRVKLIANPGAGDVSTMPARIDEVMGYLTEAGLKVSLAVVHPKKEAIPVARKAVKDGYDIVVAMGGDGTLGMVISGIMGSKVKFGIIAAGTSNDIAGSIGIPKDLKEACDLIAAGNIRKLDVGQISTKKTKKFYFFSVVALGLTATIYPMIKNIPEGKFDGLKKAVDTFLKYKTRQTVYMTLNDESKIKVETMLVTVANTPLIGLRNTLAPDAVLDDGLLDVAVYPNFTKTQLLAYFARTANEGKVQDSSIQRYQARKIKVKSKPKMDVAAEGIVIGKGKARIKVLPGALRVIAPEVHKGAEKAEEIGVEKAQVSNNGADVSLRLEPNIAKE